MKTRITKASAARQAAHVVIAAAQKPFSYKGFGKVCETEVVKVGWEGGSSWETNTGYIWRLIGYGKSSFGWSPETVLWSTSDPNQAVLVARTLEEESPIKFAGLEDEIRDLVQSIIDRTNTLLAEEKPEWLPCHLQAIFTERCAA